MESDNDREFKELLEAAILEPEARGPSDITTVKFDSYRMSQGASPLPDTNLPPAPIVIRLNRGKRLVGYLGFWRPEVEVLNRKNIIWRRNEPEQRIFGLFFLDDLPGILAILDRSDEAKLNYRGKEDSGGRVWISSQTSVEL